MNIFVDVIRPTVNRVILAAILMVVSAPVDTMLVSRNAGFGLPLKFYTPEVACGAQAAFGCVPQSSLTSPIGFVVDLALWYLISCIGIYIASDYALKR